MMRKMESQVFPMTLMYIDDEESFWKLIKRFKLEDAKYEENSDFETYYPPEGCAHTMAMDTDNGFLVVVTLGEQETEERATSVIVHESVHVWHFLKKAIHEDHAGEEINAYATQYYATWLLKQRAEAQAKRAAQPKTEQTEDKKEAQK